MQIYPERSRLPNVAAGKAWASCDVVRGNSQMIVMGGYYANTSFTSCDAPKYVGQHGLLLGQESMEVAPPDMKWWWRLWPGYNKYRVPDKIVSLIGGEYVLQLYLYRFDHADEIPVLMATLRERHQCRAGPHRLLWDRTSKT